jgi:hypothetical protein
MLKDNTTIQVNATPQDGTLPASLLEGVAQLIIAVVEAEVIAALEPVVTIPLGSRLVGADRVRATYRIEARPDLKGGVAWYVTDDWGNLQFSTRERALQRVKEELAMGRIIRFYPDGSRSIEYDTPDDAQRRPQDVVVHHLAGGAVQVVIHGYRFVLTPQQAQTLHAELGSETDCDSDSCPCFEAGRQFAVDTVSEWHTSSRA